MHVKLIAIVLAMSALLSAAPAYAEQAASINDGEWPVTIERQHRPGTYWWCPGSAFDEDNIDWNLGKLKESGIGTAHIVPIYGANGYEERYIEFLSPQWMEQLDYIVKKADTLGLNVDMTTGTGWCFGGPDLSLEQGNVVARYDAESKQVNVEQVRMVKRAAPGGEGTMLDPYSPDAMRYYLERFDEAFNTSGATQPRAQYHDSFEYLATWTANLLDTFKARRGYDLADHLDEFFSKDEHTERQGRLKYDYRLTLSELHFETMKVWTDWSRERGMLTRNEAHGSGANILDVYAECDIPETEMFGSPEYAVQGFRRDPAFARKGDSNPLFCRFASSAAHVAHEPGRQLVSSESCTWLRENWHTSLANVKLELDQFFLTGINHIFYHGTAYSPKDAPWPGWFFYAATKFDWRNSIWRDFPALNAYVTRCQSILQAGAPANDVLVYWPVHDLWMEPSGMTTAFKVHNPVWLTEQRYGMLAQELVDKGFSIDFISDMLLEDIDFREGKLQAKGGAYQAIVIPACEYIPVDTLRKLADLAEQGATILFDTAFPAKVPGLAQAQLGLDMLQAEQRRLSDAGTKAEIDIADALTRVGVERETMADGGLQYIRREVDGGYYYFIVNQTAHRWDGWTPIAKPLVSARRHDPLTGRSGSLAVKANGRRSSVYLQLESGESTILYTSTKPASGPSWEYYRPAGNSVEIKTRWNVKFIEGGPALPAPFSTNALTSWTEAADKKVESFSGTARYSTVFTLDDATGDEWLLDLGDVRESARVRINGTDVGTLFSLPFQTLSGTFLKRGENHMEVEVTNLTTNRIRALDQGSDAWRLMKDANIVSVAYKKFDAANWPIKTSGLLGPVRLIPLVRFEPK